MSPAELKHEEFSRAVALGLFDYMRKSRSRGFVISLSGGADSAAVATLCALQVQLGVAELGLAGYLEKLAYWPELQGAELRDAVLDVVERHLEDVQLPVP